AVLSVHYLLGFTTLEATNAYMNYDRDILKCIEIQSHLCFELNLEITVKSFLAGYRFSEVPCLWKDRTQGKSRFKLLPWLPHYLKWYFYAFRPRRQSARIEVLPRGAARD